MHYILNKGKMQPATLHKSVLIQGLSCVVPSMALLAAGYASQAGQVFAGILCLWLLILGLRQRPTEAAALLLGTIPLVGMFRGMYIPYLSLVALVVAAIGLWLIVEPAKRHDWVANRPVVALSLCGFAYWWITFLITLDYSKNLRVIELCVVTSLVVMLASRRSYLCSSLLMIGFSAIGLAAGFLPHGERLGMAVMDDGLNLGNPILIGLPLSLLILLSMAEGGRWLMLEKQPVLRLALVCTASGFLFLSTSRGSWVVTLMGCAVLFFTGSAKQRAYLAMGVAFMAAAFMVVGMTERGAAIDKFIGKVAGEDATINTATTGRARQWEAIPKVLADSPLIGFGPGSSTATTGRYTGKPLKWHSLYLQVAGELGILGISVVTTMLGYLGWQCVRYWRRTREVLPMLALACYMTIGISISGFDSLSGVYLGLATLSCSKPRLRRLRAVAKRPYPSEAAA